MELAKYCRIRIIYEQIQWGFFNYLLNFLSDEESFDAIEEMMRIFRRYIRVHGAHPRTALYETMMQYELIEHLIMLEGEYGVAFVNSLDAVAKKPTRRIDRWCFRCKLWLWHIIFEADGYMLPTV